MHASANQKARRSPVAAYGISLAAVAAAIGARLLLEPLFGDRFPLITPFVAVLFAAWYGGQGPALLAMACGVAAAAYLFVEPRYSFALNRHEYQLGLVLYCVVGFAAMQVFESLRKARHGASEKSELLRVTLASIGEAVITTDSAGRITQMNAVAETLSGWNVEAASGQLIDRVFRIVSERTRLPCENPVTRVMREGAFLGHSNQSVLIARDGTERHIDISAASIKDADSSTTGVVLIFRDVTERHRSEVSLRESEARFRQLANSIPQHVWIAQPDGSSYWFNQQWSDFTGKTPEELEGWGWQSVHDPQELPAVLEKWQVSIATGSPFEMVLKLRSADGEFRSFLTRITPIRDPEGKVLRWFGTNTDITDRVRMEASLRRSQDELECQGRERKQAEESLRASERIYRAIGESIDYGVWVCDAEGRNTYASPSFLRLVGITQEQCGEFGWGKMLHPDDADRTIAAWQECVKVRGKWDIEHRFRGVDGEWHPILARGVPVEDEDGKLLCWAGINLDIRRLKAAEQALQQAHGELEQRVKDRTAELLEVNKRLCREIEERRATEARLRDHAEEIETLMDVLPVAVWISHDPECRKMTGNRATYELIGLPHGANVSKSAPLDQRPSFRVTLNGKEMASENLPMQRAAATGQEVRNAELDLMFDDGSIRSIFGFAAPLFDASRQVRGCIGAFIDITERRRLENRLRESEERYRAVVEDQTEVVSRFRADGRFLFVNDVFCRTFGKPSTELIGQHWVPVVFEEDVALVQEKLATLTWENPIIRVENRVYDALGKVRWMEFVNRGFFDADGKLAEIQAVGRDVTERKQIEERLRSSLREKEVLLKEIYHRVKNNLQVISSLLDLQSLHTTDRPTIMMFRESQQRVRSMALVHERLYRSGDLANINFTEYLVNLADHLFQSYRVSSSTVRLELDTQDEVRIAIDVAVPCGLLVNELLSNSLKHAFRGRSGGGLRIGLHALTDGKLQLVVADDGVGFPADIDVQNPTTFGLQLVNLLVEQLHADMEIDRVGGTAIRITFVVSQATSKPTEATCQQSR